MASDPFSVAQELAEVKAAKELAHEYGWAEDSKEYMSMLSSIRKKHKGLMKMSKMTAMTGMESSSAKQTKKEKIIWVDSAKKDADNFKEAVELLPEVFGEGRYGTSGVKSRGGQQNFNGELCAWKRVAKDGKNYRILEHTTGYFYQEGFLPSDTAEGEQEEEEDKEEQGQGEDEQDDDQEEDPAPAPASKKQKKGKGAVAAAPAPAKAAQEPKKPKRKEPKEPKRTSNRRNA